jgi:hypothetical protein
LITINVKANFDDVIRKLNAHGKAIEKAQVSALNKAAAQSRTQMQRAITSSYMLPASFVRERLSVRRAVKQGVYAFTASLVGGGKRSMNMIHFVEKSVTLAEGRRRAKSGTLSQLRFAVKRGGGRKPIPGAFIGNKGRTVFMREGKSRLPIKPVQTISVPSMFNTRKNIGEVTAWLRDNLPRIFEHELRYYMSQIK